MMMTIDDRTSNVFWFSFICECDSITLSVSAEFITHIASCYLIFVFVFGFKLFENVLLFIRVYCVLCLFVVYYACLFVF